MINLYLPDKMKPEPKRRFTPKQEEMRRRECWFRKSRGEPAALACKEH